MGVQSDGRHELLVWRQAEGGFRGAGNGLELRCHWGGDDLSDLVMMVLVMVVAMALAPFGLVMPGRSRHRHSEAQTLQD